MATITSANAVFLLSVPGVTFSPQLLQAFGVDDAFATDAVEIGETQVGVDGVGVAGFIPREVPMTIRFLASSVSVPLFENWIAFEDQAFDKVYASGIITLASVGKKYTLGMGALTRIHQLPDARKVLSNREFRINWLPNGPGQPAVSAAPM